MKSTRQIIVFASVSFAALALVSGCAAFKPTSPSKGPTGTTVAPTPRPADLESYLAVFDRLAPGDPARQYSAVADLASLALTSPTASNRLKYALALGAAGRSDSNPIEAKRLISELLAEQTDLRPEEISLANAWLREYDARVALYADLARQREESQFLVRRASFGFEQPAGEESEDHGAERGDEVQRQVPATVEDERLLAREEVQEPLIG